MAHRTSPNAGVMGVLHVVAFWSDSCLATPLIDAPESMRKVVAVGLCIEFICTMNIPWVNLDTLVWSFGDVFPLSFVVGVS